MPASSCRSGIISKCCFLPVNGRRYLYHPPSTQANQRRPIRVSCLGHRRRFLHRRPALPARHAMAPTTRRNLRRKCHIFLRNCHPHWSWLVRTPHFPLFMFLSSSANSRRLILCAVYYYVWIKVLPKRRGYAIRQELIVLETGETAHSLVNVPLEKIPEWDSVHDVTGKKYATSSGRSSGEDSMSVERTNAKSVKE